MNTKYKILQILSVVAVIVMFAGVSLMPASADAFHLPLAAVQTTCSNDNGDCATCETSASDCTSDTPDTAVNTCGENSCDLVKDYINPAIDLLSGLVGIVAVISLITAGIQYSASAGDPQKSAKAKGRITGTIIALLAYIFLYAFLEFIIPGGLLNK
jgi:uncharacterized membrane protein